MTDSQKSRNYSYQRLAVVSLEKSAGTELPGLKELVGSQGVVHGHPVECVDRGWVPGSSQEGRGRFIQLK